jgi:ankyrin repeat protein
VSGSSVLTLSAASGDIEEVEILLDGGADPDRPTDALGGTPLMMALDLGHWDVARLLMARGADPTSVTTGHMTSLIELSGSWPSAPAQRHEQAALAADLIDHGVGVDDQLSGPGTSALMMAAIRGNEELVQLLLHRGANPRLEDRKGRTALDFATRKGNIAVAEVLASATASAAPASSAH